MTDAANPASPASGPAADRQARLLLRFLTRLPATGARAKPSASRDRIELSCAGGSFLVEAAVLSAAARAGLVERQGAVIRPLPEAKAFLSRHDAAGGADFAAQHRMLECDTVMVEGDRETVTRNLAESPLSLLERLKDRDGARYFPREAIAAGERFHADFTRGQLQPQITMRFEPRLHESVRGGRGGNAEMSDTALAARLRITRAVAAMGPELAGVALDVCCFMKGLETVERERQWPARSAKLMLKTALLALQRHYAPPARSPMRHWGEGDYRAELG